MAAKRRDTARPAPPGTGELPGVVERALPAGRLRTEAAVRLAYEADGWALARCPPLAVAFPESTEEVAALVQACRAAGLPIMPRGAGTCLSGGATPAGEDWVVVELARMDAILELCEEDRYARVQAGRINLELSAAASPWGLHFAPDPSSQRASTLGGNAAENAGGPHCFKYGMTTDHVLGLTLVDGEGRILRARRGEGPDLTGLVVGSEGTFGVVTELELALVPTPEAVHTFLASFPSLPAACRAVARIVRSGTVPAALEILDRLAIQAVEASVYAAGYPKDAEAVLLVELDGPRAEVDAEIPEVRAALAAEGALAVEDTEDPERRERLWRGRKGAFGAMGRLKPDLFVLDGVVPPSRLAAVLERTVAIGREEGVVLSNVFHAGDGNLHPNISFDGRDPDERRRAVAAGRRILELCVAEGGSISGEHGVGLEKLDYLHFLFDETDLAVFADVRACFDPDRICNPGKLLPWPGGCREVRAGARPGRAPEGGGG